MRAARVHSRLAAAGFIMVGALPAPVHAQSFGQLFSGQSAGVPVLGGQGYAQTSPAPYQGPGGYDPCAPQPMAGGAFGLITAALNQHQRSQACAAKRQAQWADYNAKQKAAKDQADAAREQANAAAAQAKARTEADMQARDQAAQRKVASAARTAKQREAAAVYARRTEIVSAAARARAEQQAASDRRVHAIALARAEAAPGNVCRQPVMARGVMQGWNGLDTFKATGVKVIDIEHVTTVFFHPEDHSFSCHGVFVTSGGWKIAGTTTVKHNVAGDPMFLWARDTSQDLSIYDALPPIDASSPEMASQSTVGVSPAGYGAGPAQGPAQGAALDSAQGPGQRPARSLTQTVSAASAAPP